MGKVVKKKQDKEPSAPDKCPKAWEKARRDRMKILFDELSRLLPKFDPSTPPSRPEIIKKAMSYIRDLQAQNEDLLNGGFDEVYKKKIETWKRRVKELLCRVEQLSGILRTANIHLPPLAIENVPSWTTKRPKYWTEKVIIPEEKLGDVIKQLSTSKKKRHADTNKETVQNKISKLEHEVVLDITTKENVPKLPKKIKARKNIAPAIKKQETLKNISSKPVSVQTSSLVQPPFLAQHGQTILPSVSCSQPSTFLLTNQGSLLPVLTPNAGVLTPVLINRPPPLLVIQTPSQPQPVTTILSKPPPNKKRIARDSTVMTFSIKRPISALSKHSHGRRAGKCLGHKKSLNVLLPSSTSTAPAVSPTAAFLNSFPVVATPKIFNSEETPVSDSKTLKYVDTQEIVSDVPDAQSKAISDADLNTSMTNPEKVNRKNLEPKTEITKKNESTSSIANESNIAFSSDVTENNEKEVLAGDNVADTSGVNKINADQLKSNISDNPSATSAKLIEMGEKDESLTNNGNNSPRNTELGTMPVNSDGSSCLVTLAARSNDIHEAHPISSSVQQKAVIEIPSIEDKVLIKDSQETLMKTTTTSNIPSSKDSFYLDISYSKNTGNNTEIADNVQSKKTYLELQPRFSSCDNTFSVSTEPVYTPESSYSKWQVSSGIQSSVNNAIPSTNVISSDSGDTNIANQPLDSAKNKSPISANARDELSLMPYPSASKFSSNATTMTSTSAITTAPVELHQSSNSWLSVPPIYSNDRLTKTSTANTWRPITSEPGWSTVAQTVGEPWKLDVGVSVAPPTYLKEVSSSDDKSTAKINKNPVVSLATTNFYYTSNSETLPNISALSSHASWSSNSIVTTNATFSNIQTTQPVSSSASSQVNHHIPFPFTSNYRPNVGVGTSMAEQNQPWSTVQREKNCESIFKPPLENTIQKSVATTPVSFTSIATQSLPSYSANQYKTNIVPTCLPIKNDPTHIDSSSFPSQSTQSSALKLPNSSVPSSNYTLTDLNTFNINSYPAALPKKTNNAYSANYATTFANDVPTFSLEMSKALFNDPPYSLTVPKTTSDSYFSNVPTYHPATSTHFTSHSSHVSRSTNSKTSVPFITNTPDSIPETKVASKSFPEKESNPVITPAADNKNNIFNEPKLIRQENSYAIPCPSVSISNQNSSRLCNKPQKHATSDSSTNLWNAPCFTQSSTNNLSNEVGGSWGHVDYAYVSDNKDNRIKPPINWMTEPDQRSEIACHNEDAYLVKYQNVFDRKEAQGSHNVLDFCFNNQVEDDSNRGKNKRKDGEHSTQDYFGWASMKVDPLVVPSTLPTLVGDLALGGEPIPSKICKTPILQESYGQNRSEKLTKDGDTHLIHEPFTNLSKNIFDTSQNENKSTNTQETIVLKNIFELPAPPSGKQRPNHPQNTFLSVSQLVSNEPHNIDSGQVKSDYTYYNQRSGKGKRGSGWKCGEKKCQQSGKACSSYSAEALLRSSDVIPNDEEFPLLGQTVFPVEFQNDHTFIEPTDTSSNSVRPKTNSTRTRKGDAWKTEEYKASVTSSISQPFLSPARPPVPKKIPDISFSFSNLSGGPLPTPQAPNIHLSHNFSADLSYPRFPSNPTAPILHGHSFPQTKPDDMLLSSPNRSCPTEGARYQSTNRKSLSYPRNHMKQSFSYPMDGNVKSTKSVNQPGGHSVSSAYSKSHTQAYSNKPPHTPNSLIGTPQTGSPVYHTKTTIASSPSSDTSMYCSKGTNSYQKLQSSPASGNISYSLKISEKIQQPPNSAPLALSASYLSKPSDAIPQTINTHLSIAPPYTSFPSLPPHLAASSSNSLANFNLTTIFPEMNKKGYQYS